MEPGQAHETLDRFLEQVVRNGRFDLQYAITSGSQGAGEPAADTASVSTAAARFAVNFSGPDVPFLTARNGELLHAIESIAAELLQLAPGEHHLLAFDAEGFRAERARSLEQAVEQACEGVKRSGRPHAFPPMNSRERRLVHLGAARHGITTASSGEGPRRSVVLYPAGVDPNNVPVQAAVSGGALSPSLPGERRSQTPHIPDDFGNRAGSSSWGDRRGSRPGFGGPRPGGGGRFGGSPSRSGPRATPYDAQPSGDGANDAGDNQPSAEDRARAIRERFRKR